MADPPDKPELQNYVKDHRWLFVRCREAGLSKPDGADCEAFSERVAILLAENPMTEQQARDAAFQGHRQRRHHELHQSGQSG